MGITMYRAVEELLFVLGKAANPLRSTRKSTERKNIKDTMTSQLRALEALFPSTQDAVVYE